MLQISLLNKLTHSLALEHQLVKLLLHQLPIPSELSEVLLLPSLHPSLPQMDSPSPLILLLHQLLNLRQHQTIHLQDLAQVKLSPLLLHRLPLLLHLHNNHKTHSLDLADLRDSLKLLLNLKLLPLHFLHRMKIHLLQLFRSRICRTSLKLLQECQACLIWVKLLKVDSPILTSFRFSK